MILKLLNLPGGGRCRRPEAHRTRHSTVYDALLAKRFRTVNAVTAIAVVSTGRARLTFQRINNVFGSERLHGLHHSAIDDVADLVGVLL
ncbi:hypothetical protein ACFVZW_12145 [Streptomyces sp. NPDC059567]|uniref:hypothetical protein n=1 Tax=Streptomyces sp. NPDC059567 TaxID=3346867 RepID=UPI0036825DF3